MLILLPPSEGKSAPPAGPPVDLDALAYADALGARRERLLGALVRLSGGSRKRALAALGLAKGQADELERNATLREAPAAPAAEVYTGVLFERLRLAELPAAAHEHVLIASALWGVLHPGDRIPAYKLSMGGRLPRVGPLAAYWRPALRSALPESGLVVDLRSGSYAAAWRPAGAQVVGVRGFVEQGGERKTITHMVKATRGEVARLLLEAGPAPADPEGVAAVVSAAGREVELTGEGGVWSLDVIERG